MAIHYINKNVTTVGLGIIAHGVNCQGRMNSGVAKDIREKWPQVFVEFSKHPNGAVALGQCQLVRIEDNDSLWVANLFTQQFYGYGGGRYASPEAITTALDRCGLYAEMYTLPIFMPKIGCGRGGLSWEKEVKQIVESAAEKHAIDIYICEFGKPYENNANK